MSTSHSTYRQNGLFAKRSWSDQTETDGNVYGTSQPPFQGASSPVIPATPGLSPTALKRKLTLLQLIDELTELRDSTADAHGIPQGEYINRLRVLHT
jgi:hypothetical protein